MVSDATHADLTVDAKSVREPYATGFLYTQEADEDPKEVADQTFEYVAAESDPLTLGATDDGYEAAYATVETAHDEYINVRYPGRAYATVSSFQHTSEPWLFSSADVAVQARDSTDSAYGLSVLSALAAAVAGVEADAYEGESIRPSIVVGDPGDGAHLIDPLSASSFAGPSEPRERAGGIASASILGGLGADDSAVPFARVIGRATARSAQTAVYGLSSVDAIGPLGAGFDAEFLRVFLPTTPIGDVSAGPARRVFGGSAFIDGTTSTADIRRRFRPGDVLDADAVSVSAHTVDKYRRQAAIAALLDTSNTIPTVPQAVTPGVVASREIGEDAYDAGRHLGSTLDTDVPSREYEIGLALTVTTDTSDVETTYAFAQALAAGIDFDPGNDVYRGAELSPEAYSIVTVTDDTYVMAYEAGEVYVLYPVLRGLSGDFDADELWVKQGVKLGDDVVWTGTGSPGGLSL